jgi:sec-independent protein translocase protein TatA
LGLLPAAGGGGVSMFEGLFQPMHLLVIFAIALLVFGPKKLPELGKGIGEGIRALKDGMKEHSAEPSTIAHTEVKSATPEDPSNRSI